jgi:hypothetical protein
MQRCPLIAHPLSTWSMVVHVVSRLRIESNKQLFSGFRVMWVMIIQRQIHILTLSSARRPKTVPDPRAVN